jgi:hypothetical protein
MEMARNVSCRISLDEAGLDMGGLYVLPRSHLENYGGNDKIKEPASTIRPRRRKAARHRHLSLAPGTLAALESLISE